MDIQFPDAMILVSFLSMFMFLTLSSRFKTKKPTPNLPPGPWKLPFIGNLHNLVGCLPHRALNVLAMKYGPLMHLQLGELPVVVVSSADAAKEVLKTHDVNFASRPSILVSEIISYGSTSVSFSPYGDYWRQLKKICTLELLSTKRVQSFSEIREQVFLDLTRWIACQEGSSINFSEKLYSSAYDVTSRAALGKETKEKETLLAIIKEIGELAAGFDIADLYPSIKLLQVISGLRRKLKKLHEEADRILEDIILDHKLARKCTDRTDKHEDLVDVLLKFQDHALELPLSNDNIKSLMVDILAGGSETSATTMDWAMAEMLKNPRVLGKAQDEVRRLFDDKGYVDESDVPGLKYLKSVIKETLRIHPPLPLLLPRKCGQTCEINGFDIPINTKIILNAWAINRDRKHWENAEVFQPERFLDSLVDYRGNHFEYIPFGAGRRMCPGMSFGIANIELPLAMFLYHFDWKLGNGKKHEEMDMTEGFGVTARKKQPLYVVPVVKRSLRVK